MRPKFRRLAEPSRKARQAAAKTATRIPTPIGRVSATLPPTPLSLTSLNLGVPAVLGVDEAASLPCEVVAPPEGDVPDVADGTVLVSSVDASPAAGAADADRCVAAPCCAVEAVDMPRFSACDEAFLFCVVDVAPREEWLVVVGLTVLVAEPLVLVAEPRVFVTEPLIFEAALLFFGAELLVLVAELVVLVPGLALAGLVAAGLVAACVVVAVLVVVVLVAAGVVLAELVVGVLDGDPACC